jgi:hypothetical protein
VGRSLWVGISLLLIIAVGFACGGEDSKPESQPAFSDADLDSLLLALVPPPKHRAPRCQEWLGKQKAAIRSADLDPSLVIEVITWHRSEISEASQIQGYTTYPLVKWWETSLRLDSLVALTVTELNREPHWPQPTMFHPGKGSGVAFGSDLMQNMTAAIDLSGAGIGTAEDFRVLCLGFTELAFRDPQIILTDSLQWQLHEIADSLVNRNPERSEASELSRRLLDRAATLHLVEMIDTLTEARALEKHLDSLSPGWREQLPSVWITGPEPTLQEGEYMWQIDILDGYSMQLRLTIFHYNSERGFWLEDVQKRPPVRRRIQVG